MVSAQPHKDQGYYFSCANNNIAFLAGIMLFNPITFKRTCQNHPNKLSPVVPVVNYSWFHAQYSILTSILHNPYS